MPAGKSEGFLDTFTSCAIGVSLWYNAELINNFKYHPVRLACIMQQRLQMKDLFKNQYLCEAYVLFSLI